MRHRPASLSSRKRADGRCSPRARSTHPGSRHRPCRARGRAGRAVEPLRDGLPGALVRELGVRRRRSLDRRAQPRRPARVLRRAAPDGQLLPAAAHAARGRLEPGRGGRPPRLSVGRVRLRARRGAARGVPRHVDDPPRPAVDDLGAGGSGRRHQPAHLPGGLLGPSGGGARGGADRRRRDRVGPAPLAARRADAGRRAGHQAMGRAGGGPGADRSARGHARAPRGDRHGAGRRAHRADARGGPGSLPGRAGDGQLGEQLHLHRHRHEPVVAVLVDVPPTRASTGSARRPRSPSTRCPTTSDGSCTSA